MNRIFFMGFLTAGSIVYAAVPASIAQINEQMQALNSRIEEIRTASALQSHDATLVEQYFLYTIKQNPAIQVMARIDTDGTLLNRVNGRGASRQVANVAKERWFSNLCKTKKPFNGALADGNGRALLFRAWPIIESSDSVARLTGVFSVKIDINKYLAVKNRKNEMGPVQILYHGTPLFSRNWNRNEIYDEWTINLSGPEGDKLTVRYEKAGAQAVSSVAGGKMETAPEENPPLNAKVDSIRKAGFSALSDHHRFSGIGLIAGIAVVLIIAVMLALYLRLRRSGTSEFYKVQHAGPFDAVLLDEELQAIAGEHPFITEANTLEECLSMERETKVLPVVIRERISETSKKHHEYDHGTDQDLRNEIINKIHDDLNVWVRSEFVYLSDRLNQVSETIKQGESKDGSSTELRELRYEIGKIREEIVKLKKRLPQEMMVVKT